MQASSWQTPIPPPPPPPIAIKEFIKGPPVASKHFPIGTIQKGEDGKDWYVHKTNTGSRWQRCKANHQYPIQQQPHIQPQIQQQPQTHIQPQFQPPPPQQQQQRHQIQPQPRRPPVNPFQFAPVFGNPTNEPKTGSSNPFAAPSHMPPPALQFSAGPPATSSFLSDLLSYTPSQVPTATPILPSFGPTYTTSILQPSGFNTNNSMDTC